MSRALAGLVHGLPGLVYRCRNDVDYTTEFVSDGVEALTGYPAADFRSHRRHFGDVIHPQDRGLVRAKIAAALEAKRPFELTYRIVHASGATKWMWEKGRALYDARGRARALEGFVTDVDERKQAHEALRASEQRLRAIIEAEPECVKTVSREGRLLEMNPAGLAMLEADSLAAVQARPLLDFLVPASRPGFIALHQRVLAGESGTLEFDVVGLRGGRRRLETHAVPLPDALGRPAALLGITRDITERRRAEQALRESEERFRSLTELSSDFYWEQDENFRFVEREGAAAEKRPYPREDVIGRTRWDLPALNLAEADWAAHRAELEARREFRNFEIERPGADGRSRWISTSGRPIFDAAGRFRGYRGVGADITDRKLAERALRATSERLRMLVESSPLAIYTRGRDGLLTSWNPAAEKMFGWSAAEVLGKPLPSVPEEERAASDALRMRLLAGESLKQEALRRRRDGTPIHIDAFVGPLRDGGGAIEGIIAIVADVTERRRAETRIRRLNRVHAVLSGINGLIVRMRSREELYRGACRIAGEHGGFPIAWIGEVDREAQQVKPAAGYGTDERFFAAIRMTIRDDAPEGLGLVGQAVRTRAPVVANDAAHDPRVTGKGRVEGDTRAIAVLPLMVGGEARGVLVLHSDAVGFFDEEEMKLLGELAGDIAFALDHIEKAERVNYLAYYDALTGLANATLFHERLAQSVHAAQRENAKIALLLFDVERFKAINDSLGRQAGDALLAELGARLGRAVNARSLARLGADHFAVVLPAVRGRSQTVRELLRLHRDCFAAPFGVGGTELRIAARAGIALFPNDGADAQTLFANAEAALDEAQRSGERYCFHTRALTAGVGRQLALENKLRRAIERDEFTLHYQPKLDAETGALAGLEALIRWRSPELGLVPPRDFIPLLEETGLILEVGSWALRRAALDHRAWTESGLKPPRVAVNVSPVQLRSRDFVALVERAIMDGVAPVGIDLEITESLIMEDIAGNKEKLARVRALGVRLAIDDFGTGYSSLAYLATLPVQALKIDRSFIVAMEADSNAMTLVSTIISLAHSLRLKVVAEGVETEEQAKYLRLLRCNEMQGYLFGRPMPAEAIPALLSVR